MKTYSTGQQVLRMGLYALIGALAVLSPALESGRPVTAPVVAAALLAAANAVRSYVDQSGAGKDGDA